jgi:hypothetical protein
MGVKTDDYCYFFVKNDCFLSDFGEKTGKKQGFFCYFGAKKGSF